MALRRAQWHATRRQIRYMRPVRWLAVLIVSCSILTAPAAGEETVRVASKNFTESVILGEMVALLVRDAGLPADHQRDLGGTRILFNALIVGEIDAYPEYTGTLAEEIFAGQGLEGNEAIRAALREQGIRMSRPIGFNNTYAMGMTKSRAAELAIESISDLRDHPDLQFGFSSEFIERGDGWPSMRDRYGLPQSRVRGIDHDIAYRALDDGSIDMMDLYATDAKIGYYDLAVLEDDLRHFPRYDAVVLYRAELAERAPDAVESILRLEGLIDAEAMIAVNGAVDIDKRAERVVAADFLSTELDVESDVVQVALLGRLMRTTREHLTLVGVSMCAAVLLAVPLGIWAARGQYVAQPILGVVGIVQTIPALALLVLLMAALRPFRAIGIDTLGEPPAILALFLYSLLPIVRNTYSGLTDIPRSVRESAEALGLPPMVQLIRIELPIASRSILGGIKTAVVINVGFATLGALIGAGGYGQPILTGIRRDDVGTILEGALPAAALALLAQGLFELLDRLVIPKGLRL